jgi:hypothetical protein
MKMTLLEMVQDILNDMDSDEVNSINDTVESVQVAQIIKTCYFEMLSNRNWPHTRKLIQLDAVGSVSKPNYMKLPDTLKELVSFKYDVRKEVGDKLDIVDLKYKDSESFLRYISQRNSLNSNIDSVVDYSGTKLLILNDTAPTYWTSFDDVYLVTDAYNSNIESTLQSSKSQCLAYLYPEWTKQDSFIPDLPIDAFSALLEEAKSTAFATLKQMINQKAEQKATRQQRWLSRKSWRAHGGVKYSDFGRKSRR